MLAYDHYAKRKNCSKSLILSESHGSPRSSSKVLCSTYTVFYKTVTCSLMTTCLHPSSPLGQPKFLKSTIVILFQTKFSKVQNCQSSHLEK